LAVLSAHDRSGGLRHLDCGVAGVVVINVDSRARETRRRAAPTWTIAAALL
jgi:hypothetical protein